MGQDTGKATKTKSPHIRERIFDPFHFALCADAAMRSRCSHRTHKRDWDSPVLAQMSQGKSLQLTLLSELPF